MMTQNKKVKQQGFTIVELLVVIVVIGILASITFVSYNGITNRAKASQAAISAVTVVKKLEVYNGEVGNYPATYSLLTGAASTASYYIAPGSITLKATALTSTDTSTTVNYASCTTPNGYRVSHWNFSGTPAAVMHTYVGNATSASTCTLITS